MPKFAASQNPPAITIKRFWEPKRDEYPRTKLQIFFSLQINQKNSKIII